MEYGVSRRGFLVGVGTGAAGTTLLLLAGRQPPPDPPPPFRLALPAPPDRDRMPADECCASAEHDGWLVNTADKRRLSLEVVDYTLGWFSPAMKQGTRWRWSRQTATLTISNPGVDAVLHLDHDAAAGYFRNDPRTIAVSVGERVIESFVANTPGRHRHGIPLPAGVLGDANRAEIRIAVDRPFVPVERISTAQDARELGIQVFGVSVELAPGTIP